jgi:acetyl esterase/lipase
MLERPTHVAPVRPAGLVLFSPEVDLRLDEASITENADRDILPWNIPTAAYLHGFDATSKEVSPLTADLSKFPPTCVTWGGDEMFRDPIRRYVDRLRGEGVPTEAQEFPGMFHVFQILMPWAEASREAFRLVRSFIHKLVEDAPALPPSDWQLAERS